MIVYLVDESSTWGYLVHGTWYYVCSAFCLIKVPGTIPGMVVCCC